MSLESEHNAEIERVKNFLRGYQGCAPNQSETFLSLDTLNELILNNTGISISRSELVECLDALSFNFKTIDGERFYPVKVLS